MFANSSSPCLHPSLHPFFLPLLLFTLPLLLPCLLFFPPSFLRSRVADVLHELEILAGLVLTSARPLLPGCDGQQEEARSALNKGFKSKT